MFPLIHTNTFLYFIRMLELLYHKLRLKIILDTRVKKLNHFSRIQVSSQMLRTHLISLADILVNTHRLHIQLHQRYCSMHSRCSYQCVCIARALYVLYAGNIVPVDHGISCRWMRGDQRISALDAFRSISQENVKDVWF